MLPDATRIASVSLRARDVEALDALYRDVLQAPRGLVEVVEVTPGEPMPVDAYATGLFHTAIRYGTRAHLAEALRRVAGARFQLSGASDHGVSEALYLRDPEGNGVELYWDRDPAAWPRLPDGSLAMVSDPLDLRGLLAEPTPEDAPAVDIGHVHLKVSAIDTALAFWHEALGFELQQRMGASAAFVSAGGYHHHVGLNVWHSRGAPQPAPTTAGLDHVVVEVPTRDALDAAAERLQGLDAPVDHAGVDAIRTRDLDGIGVELVVAAAADQPPSTSTPSPSKLT